MSTLEARLHVCLMEQLSEEKDECTMYNVVLCDDAVEEFKLSLVGNIVQCTPNVWELRFRMYNMYQ